MKTEKRKTGDVGEDLTCKYLEERGYELIERNYLRPWGELDIVARRGEKLHFVEVKTVTRESGEGQARGYRPEENMHRSKIQRLHRAMQTYLMGHKAMQNMDFQLDLACVYLTLSTKTAKIELVENIVL